MSILISLVCFISDQLSKRYARNNLNEYDNNEKLGGLLNFRLVYNKGAFLGLFKDNKRVLDVVTAVMIIALGLIYLPYVFSIKLSIRGFALATVFGGALGNAYDRFKRKRVTDFFSFYPRHKVYFNLADIFIFIGVVVLFVADLFDK